MKKFFLTRAGVVLMCLVGCFAAVSCGGSGNADTDTDTATYTATSDTLSALMGHCVGRQMLSQLLEYRTLVDSTYSIADFADGISVVIDRRHPLAFANGASMALQANQDFDALEDAGFKIDRSRMLDIFESNINPNDSVAPEALQTAGERYMAFMEKLVASGASKATPEQIDTLQMLYGKLLATSLNMDIHNYYVNEGKPYDSATFVRGMRAVASERHSVAYCAGVYQGAMLAEQMAVIEKKGVNVRRETVLDEVRKALALKKVDSDEVKASYDRFMEIMNRIDKAYYDAEDARMASTDEAIQNIKTGEALVAKMKKNDPRAKTTDSGLTYIIYSEGTGDFITDNDRVSASFTGSHLDGKVFETDREGTLTPVTVVPGLKEGLKMLKKGAKATFWVPGNLGYGGHGAAHAGIGPMETIVFDVEVTDVSK